MQRPTRMPSANGGTTCYSCRPCSPLSIFARRAIRALWGSYFLQPCARGAVHSPLLSLKRPSSISTRSRGLPRITQCAYHAAPFLIHGLVNMFNTHSVSSHLGVLAYDHENGEGDLYSTFVRNGALWPGSGCVITSRTCTHVRRMAARIQDC
ncbi:hypothetical protein PYCCODRAFT_833368 [Trametes coccinea BRFM310]|uniref:Uncharacterized protein n=1 Tax=Trametes coccinea (strain BRFM310) TaxID=1353009 RepID=A0A1Y2IEI6_TRAC3|nr:hypothetical protein PYCCODRAFT_833368 [Trametes coccinea BRFM310]